MTMQAVRYPGWRTMTSAQRRNAKMEAMFERARQQGHATFNAATENTTMEILVRRTGFARREPTKAYACGRLAVHRDLSASDHWIVTHPESGMSVTGGRCFDSRAQAKRFADEMQRHLDFAALKSDSDVWDVQAAFGSEKIRRAMSAAFQEAFGS